MDARPIAQVDSVLVSYDSFSKLMLVAKKNYKQELTSSILSRAMRLRSFIRDL